MKKITVKSFVKEKVLSIFISVFMLVSSTIGTITAADNEDLVTDNSKISIVDEQTEPNTEPTEPDTDLVEEDENLSTVDVTFLNFDFYFIGLTVELTNILDETDKKTFEISDNDDNTITIPIGEYTLKILSDNGTDVAEYQYIAFNISNENNTFDMSDSSVSDALVVSPPRLNEPTIEGDTHYDGRGEVIFSIEENSFNENIFVGFDVKIDGEELSEDKIKIENNSCIVSYENLTETLKITCSAYYYVEIDSNEVGSDGSIIKEKKIISGDSEEKTVKISVIKENDYVSISNNNIEVNYAQEIKFSVDFNDTAKNDQLEGTYNVWKIISNEPQSIISSGSISYENNNIVINEKICSAEKPYSYRVDFIPTSYTEKYDTAYANISITVHRLKGGEIDATKTPNEISTPCYFEISNNEKGENGWYTSDITLVPANTPENPFTKINVSSDGTNIDISKIMSNEDGSITISEETSNGVVKFTLEDTNTNELSDVATFTYKLDKTAPEKVELKKDTFRDNEVNGQWQIKSGDWYFTNNPSNNNHYDLKYDGEMNNRYLYLYVQTEDTISGIKHIELAPNKNVTLQNLKNVLGNDANLLDYKGDSLFDNNGNALPVNKDKNGVLLIILQINSINEKNNWGWHIADSVYAELERFSFIAVNNAGISSSISNSGNSQHSTQGTINVDYKYVNEPETADKDKNPLVFGASPYYFIYKESPSVTITVPENTKYESIEVTLNGEKLDIDWAEVDYKYTKNFEVNGEYDLEIKANGYGIKSNIEKFENNIYESHHIIDTITPEISVKYYTGETETDIAINNIYNAALKATITITDKNFFPDKCEFSPIITAKDICGNVISTNPFDSLEWKNDLNKWETTVDFKDDAIYSFRLTCEDLAGNNSNEVSEDFTIDKTDPIIETVEFSQSLSDNKDGILDSVLKTISFGFYNPDKDNGEFIATITATDKTSGIDYFKWEFEGRVYDKEGNLLEKDTNPDYYNGTITGNFISKVYENGEEIITAELKLPTETDEQYRGVLNFKAVDQATNISEVYYAKTDEKLQGVIIDSISPKVSIRYEGNGGKFIRKIQNNESKEDVTVADQNTKFIYNGSFRAVIEVEEDNFFINEKQSSTFADTNLKFSFEHYLNGKLLETKEDIEQVWIQKDGKWESYIDFSDEGDYILKIDYQDYSENDMIWQSDEYNKTGNYSYTSNVFTIDKTVPEISVEYSPESSETNSGMYKENRTATITVTDRNFRPSEIVTTFTAKDIQGNNISEISDIETLFGTLELWDKWDYIKTTEKGDVWQATLTFSTDANYSFELDYADLANNFADKYNTSVPFAIDHTRPENLKIEYSTPLLETLIGTITFGYYNPSVTVTIFADDITSGVDSFEWTYTQEPNTSTINEETESKTIEIGNIEYLDNEKTAKASFILTADEAKQYRGSIKFTATDKAGNKSSNLDDKLNNAVVVDTISPTRTVTYSAPKQIVDKTTMDTKTVDFNAENTNSIFYYNGTATATIKIEEANFYSEDVTIKVNDAVYAVNWSKENDIHTAVLTFSEDGDYIIDIAYTDRSENPMTVKNRKDDENQKGVYKSEQITIDTIDPVISVSYSPNNTVRTLDGRNYYNTVQTATVKVTEHNFRADDVLATIKALDSSNTAVSSNLISSLENHLKTRSSWTTNGDVHTTTLTYSNDANYSFDIEYTDLTLRKYDNYVEDLFTVDTTPPTNPTVQYSQNVFSNILNTITFGYYNEEVTVTISSVDETSGVYNFDYSAILSPNVSNVNKAIIEQAISESSVNYSNGRQNATATFTIPSSALTASNQFNGTLNFSATDRSNNNTDYQDNVRIVVDNIAPVLDVAYNEPYQIANNISYYPGDINATIKITEANFFSADVNVTVTKDGENYPVEVNWSDNNVNEHIGNFTISAPESGEGDGSYFVTINYSDRSKNKMQNYNSNQFIIDTIKPIIDKSKFSFDTADSDIWVTKTKNETPPNISFSDTNINQITDDSTFYKWQLKYENNNEITTVKKENIEKNITETENNITFSINNFDIDGIYEAVLSCIDMSGNDSGEYKITFVRLVDHDVLSYIENSYIKENTDNLQEDEWTTVKDGKLYSGLYTFMTQDLKPISLRPDNVKSTKIKVFSIENQAENRENKVQFKNTNGIDVIEEFVEPVRQNQDENSPENKVIAYTFTYTNNFFNTNIPVGEDSEYAEIVLSGEDDINLGTYHFDTDPPEITLPNELKNWHWYFGNETRTITVNVDEALGFYEVKDNGKVINATYQDNKITFELEKGLHKINISVSDLAGNPASASTVKNVYVGVLRYIVIMLIFLLLATITTFIFWKRKRKIKLVLIIGGAINLIEILTIILMTSVFEK